MENDKTKFWAFLIGLMVAVAVAVTLVDLTIKAAILQESNAFKLSMNEVKHGTAGSRANETNSDGTDYYRHNNGRDAGDDVVPFPSRMEAPTIRTATARKTGPKAMAGTAEHSERARNKRVETSDKQVDA
jgi:hypothetical protein